MEEIQKKLNSPETFEDFKKLWWISISYLMEKETLITFENWKRCVADNPSVIEFLYNHRRDCAEAKKLRKQQMSTDKKKPAYRQCFICGLADHWAPNCPKREEDFTSQQSSISTEKQQSSVSTAKP